MNAIYDENKGVYRVNNSDGTFDTYTPEQYREKFGTAVVEEEEDGDADIVIDATASNDDKIVVTQEDLNRNPGLEDAGLKVGDVGTIATDSVDFSDAVVSSGNGIGSDASLTKEDNPQV